MEHNHWLDDDCARAFWDQKIALPYQQLLEDTAHFVSPAPGSRWLDLGCGSGQLSAMLWMKSRGAIGSIVAMDCAAANREWIERHARRLEPRPAPGQFRFEVGSFSDGLPLFADGSFDGVVSGLALQYAESRDPVTGRYTDAAYRRVYREIARVLRPGGRLVFSVNVPNPKWWKIYTGSMGLGLRLTKPGRHLVNAIAMWKYGRWLKKEAARGRFHYLPLARIESILVSAGFDGIESCLSFAGQAYVISASRREAATQAA